MEEQCRASKAIFRGSRTSRGAQNPGEPAGTNGATQNSDEQRSCEEKCA